MACASSSCGRLTAGEQSSSCGVRIFRYTCKEIQQKELRTACGPPRAVQTEEKTGKTGRMSFPPRPRPVWTSRTTTQGEKEEAGVARALRRKTTVTRAQKLQSRGSGPPTCACAGVEAPRRQRHTYARVIQTPRRPCAQPPTLFAPGSSGGGGSGPVCAAWVHALQPCLGSRPAARAPWPSAAGPLEWVTPRA